MVDGEPPWWVQRTRLQSHVVPPQVHISVAVSKYLNMEAKVSQALTREHIDRSVSLSAGRQNVPVSPVAAQ